MALPAQMPSPDEARRMFKAALEEERFWEDNREEFLARYKGQFVAVDPDTRQVITTDCDFFELISKLKQHGKDPTSLWIRWIPDPKVHILL